MKQVGYNFNNYQMNTRNVQKKEAEEKAKEAKGETKPESQAPVTVNPEPVTANALDVIAKQNMGLQGVSVKPQGPDGATGTNGGNDILHLDGYDELVSQWNRENNTMSVQEKIEFLTQILSKVGNDRPAECKWGMLRTQFYIESLSEPFAELLDGLENGTIDPNNINFNNPLNDPNYMIFPGIFFPWAMHDYYQGGAIARELYGQEVSEWPKDIQATYHRQRIAEDKLFLVEFNVQLKDPNITPEQAAEIHHKIENYTQYLREEEQQLRDLLGIIKDESVVAQTQVNTPSVD